MLLLLSTAIVKTVAMNYAPVILAGVVPMGVVIHRLIKGNVSTQQMWTTRDFRKKFAQNRQQLNANNKNMF